MNTKSWVSVIAVVVVVGVAAYFGGLQIGKKSASASTSKTSTGASAAGRPAGGGRAGGFGAGGGAFGGGVAGQIISMDSSSITVKTQNGSTEIVYFTSTTPVTKEQTIAASALATGDNVVVRGTTSSGTVTATNISVVPTLPTVPAAGAPTNGAAPMIPATQGQ